ncbi:MAG TPA: ATP-dependent helicase, partial [Candidatus Marinimicrobia bacterium]|nr:ATP-dependent helicase [Candidatus Neomarinimicrobiota bacterium]
RLHCALVCGDHTKTNLGHNDYDSILLNFSPFSKNRSEMKSVNIKEEIDLLIATDCISEGQNLQDCDYLINYDIHWNPVRIIQRFGRIDRLGSKNKTIQLVNFWPTKDLDNYINLKERVEARMALVDVTATGEDNILNTEQIHDLISEDLKYRNKQLKRLKEEVLDLEDMDETISLTDFTLDDFRIELLNFLESNRKRLHEAPFGLYAIAPSPSGNYCDLNKKSGFTESENEIIKPGVVFCLKQKGVTEGNEAVNPLNPYFLVYIRNDGTVRFNYTHAKYILEIFRLMCRGRQAPYEKLCEIFNANTHHGEHMEQYSDLLKKATKEIIAIFRRRGNQRLTTDRGALLVPETQQLGDMDHFELVTWLVLL